jgi:hypothetical protein
MPGELLYIQGAKWKHKGGVASFLAIGRKIWNILLSMNYDTFAYTLALCTALRETPMAW